MVYKLKLKLDMIRAVECFYFKFDKALEEIQYFLLAKI